MNERLDPTTNIDLTIFRKLSGYQENFPCFHFEIYPFIVREWYFKILVAKFNPRVAKNFEDDTVGCFTKFPSTKAGDERMFLAK